MSEYTISRHTSGRLYAYFNGRFWRWDEAQSIWLESHLMHQKFTNSLQNGSNADPQSFLSDPASFEPLDEYELDSAMLDALKDAKPCKTVPIEPVKEAPTPSAQCSDAATAAESQTAASPAVPEGSSPTMETAPAVPSAAAPASADEESAALSAGSGSSLSNPAAPTFDYSCLPNNLCTVIRANTTEFSRHMNRSVQEYGEACINVMNVNAALAERYTGRWAQWCTSVGLSVRSATRMVEVGKSILGSAKLAELVQDGQIGKSLLQAICAPSADATAVGQVLSGNITTHKEYQDLLKENQQLRTDRVNAMNQAEREKQRADAAVSEIGERDKTIKSLIDRSEEADARADNMESKYKAALADVQGLTEKNSHLQQSYEYANEAYKTADVQRQQAEARAKNAENQLSGSRQVAEAAKLRADKLKAENDALKKQPITAVVDEEEVDRRAGEKAYEIAAGMTADYKVKQEQDARDAYDSIILAGRSITSIVQSTKLQFRKLPDDQRESAINQLVHTLASAQGEVSACL